MKTEQRADEAGKETGDKVSGMESLGPEVSGVQQGPLWSHPLESPTPARGASWYLYPSNLWLVLLALRPTSPPASDLVTWTFCTDTPSYQTSLLSIYHSSTPILNPTIHWYCFHFKQSNSFERNLKKKEKKTVYIYHMLSKTLCKYRFLLGIIFFLIKGLPLTFVMVIHAFSVSMSKKVYFAFLFQILFCWV